MAEQSTVDRDVQCVRCGYNLKSLVREGTCPECGAPIEQSLHGDLLRYADQDWLMQVVRGLVWIRHSRRWMFWTVIGLLLLLIVGLFGHAAGMTGTLEAVFNVVVDVGRWAIVLMPLGIAVGMWMVSEPEPRTEDEDLYLHAAVRGLSIAVIAAFAIWMTVVRRSAPLALSWSVQQLVMHVCYVVIWMQSLVMVKQATALERRCAAADERSIALNKRMSRNANLAFVLFLLVYWIGPLRWRTGGNWSAPSRDTARNLFMVTALAWFSVMGVLVAALAVVRQECAAGSPKVYPMSHAADGS
ncbi:MAG: hypothetical protein L0Y42_05295 [Phycisphaerales bacterium]|nr:hypothetical protein [Phycisphaerales bacterium]